MSTKNLLITLLPSTDVDLARWVLKHYDIEYIERPHAPIFHVIALKLWGTDKYPLYVEKGDRIAADPKILDHLDKKAATHLKLLPDEREEAELHAKVDELQRYARLDVGDAVVNWSYYNLLKHKAVVWPSITTGVPWFEKLGCFCAFGLIRSLMYKGLKLDQQVADEALKEVYAGFDKIDALLHDGRQYLVGDKLTYADLAVAASLGPMILVQGYQGYLPNQASCPSFMQKVYKDLRQRPTGLFIQRMYDEHR